MNEIYHLDSDWSLLDELSDGLRNRNISQKFIYQDDWADLYYDDKYSDTVYMDGTLEKEDFLSFLQKNTILWKKDNALISLWCGNSENETFILKNLNNTHIDYFGIDSSATMLELTQQKLNEAQIDAHLICADFSTNKFRQELENSTHKYDKRTFVFFSNTFGNIKHTNIIDILGNLLKKWEKIWIDIRLRKGLWVEDDFIISEIFARDLKRQESIDSYLRILNEYGIENSDGKLKMTTSQIKSIDALKFEFSFLFDKRKEIHIKWDNIIILPGEFIKLQQIYAYDPTWLINFFDEHGFQFIDKQIKWYRWQFLFEKK